jgi:NmrA-like family
VLGYKLAPLKNDYIQPDVSHYHCLWCYWCPRFVVVEVFYDTNKWHHVSGYSVVNAILADGTFTARTVTRNTMSESAEKLKARGVQVVQADLSDVESLKKAILGSEGVFGYDPSIFPDNPQEEIVQGKNLVDASTEVGVKFLVFR